MKHVAIHSVPRSGSTWLGCIFDSAPEVCYRFQPLFSYQFKSRLSENSTREDIVNFFNDIQNSKDDFINQTNEKKNGIIPNFKKTTENTTIAYKSVRYHYILRNLLEQDNDVKVVGLVRHPLEVISSWFSAPKEFRKDLEWQEIDEWRYANKKNENKKEEYFGVEKWIETTKLFEELSQLYKDRFYLIRYSNLKSETLKVVEELFDFCGVELTKSTEDFIFKSKNSNIKGTYSVFKGDRVVKNVHNISQEIQSLIIQRIKQSDLERYL